MKTLNDEHTTTYFTLGTYRLRHPLFLLFKPSLVHYPYFVVFETINHHEIKGKKNKHPYGNTYISSPSFEGEYFEGLDEACLETPSCNNESGHLSLQFCMTQPHMTLNSVKMQSVTSIRSTSDSNSFFVEGPKRWRWHLYASKMIQALGKYAFYDNKRSGKSSYILPNKYAKFEMIWLGLSYGPIGIGDQLGKENMALIKKVIKADGEIIKPDVPAVPLDACYIYKPYDVSSKKGVTVISYSQITSNIESYKVLYLLSFNMNPIGKKVTTTYALK
ncbi:MAG: hypothetical protein CVU95_15485 [Firmicutes bacterium HGW-Firmicutes-2]|jgi:hypothetical protein|nr:MAG: hypothetical protein CVU95_15485 [Firmicutes bacterium HGW-Firmicutes-2]